MKKIHNEIITLRGLNRINKAPQTIQAPIIPNASPSSSYTQNYLPTGGGAMAGAIAFSPKTSVTLSGNTLDISANGGNYSSYVKLSASVGATIKTIAGAHDNGQILFLEGGGAGPYTIDNTGNISPINASTSFSWSGQDFITLIYDFLIAKWVQVTAPSSAGAGANTTLSNLTSPTAINQDLIPGTDNAFDLGVTKRWKFVRSYSYSMGNPNYAIFQSSGIDFSLLGYSSLSPPFTVGDTSIHGLLQIKHQPADTLFSLTTGSGGTDYTTMACTGGFLFTGSAGGLRFGISAPNVSYVGLEVPVHSVSGASYTIDSSNGSGTDLVVAMADNTFTRNCTLPSAVTFGGRVLIIKNTGSKSVFVNAAAGQSIDGSASFTLTTLNNSVTIVSDGSNWLILAKV